jgi:hypothetical protein
MPLRNFLRDSLLEGIQQTRVMGRQPEPRAVISATRTTKKNGARSGSGVSSGSDHSKSSACGSNECSPTGSPTSRDC